MACNRYRYVQNEEDFLPWGENAGASGTGCTACSQEDCGAYLGGENYPLTYDELRRMVLGKKKAHLGLCGNNRPLVLPVCYSAYETNGNLYVTMRLRAFGDVPAQITAAGVACLQVETDAECGRCVAWGTGEVQVVNSTACYVVVQVQLTQLTGYCVRRCGGCSGCSGCSGCGG